MRNFTIILSLLISLLATTKGNTQTKIPKNINDDFGSAVIYNYKYGNGNTKLFIMEQLRHKGYKPMDIDVLVESIMVNSKNRDIILEVFSYFLREDEEYLYMNLLSLGISASSSKYLTEYIIQEKYKSRN